MKTIRTSIAVALSFSLSSCASIDFDSKKGLQYYEVTPMFFVTTTKDCVTTATVVGIPSAEKHLEFHAGYGSSTLTAGLTNGMLSSVGQTTDSKAPDTISAVAALAKVFTPQAFAPGAAPPAKVCKPTAKLFKIDTNGQVGAAVMTFPVEFDP